MKKPLVSSLSMSFKRATTITEDHEEAKREHRQSLKMLVEDYLEKVESGEADGIRNAKELVEVMKMDMLLMGEATERRETNELDDIKVHKVSQLLNEDDPNVQDIMKDVLMALNGANDEADDMPVRADEIPDDLDFEKEIKEEE